MLYGKCLKILTERGISAPPAGSLRLQDDTDGAGPYIAAWDTAVLGPRPTQAELDAVTQAQAEGLLKAEARDREIEQRVMKACMAATFKALKELGYTKTSAQWVALIRTEYDAL